MLARVQSLGIQGIDAFRVEVEVDLAAGLPSFTIVGLPDASIRESSDRVKAAIKKTLETKVVPEWVKRAGGAEAARLFNEIIAPHAGFTVKP